MSEPQFWIDHFGLQRHPEGGYFAEFYRSSQTVETARGPRPAGTSIYFLLEQGDFSAFHRLQSDELWHFYWGSALTLWVIEPSGQLATLRLGADPAQGQSLQALVPKNTWFAAQPDGCALVGCTMAPGFDYADFELAERAELSRLYPQHAELIGRFTRD
ncbi:MAG: cupin domain-containing protein [Meiothermus sp.]|nr:cupin domain-containing protein [Meiothermus sp.]